MSDEGDEDQANMKTGKGEHADTKWLKDFQHIGSQSLPDRWREALKVYHGVTGMNAEHKFDTMEAVVHWASNEIGHLGKTHRKEQKSGKLRSHFNDSVDYMIDGTGLLNGATVTNLHPAITLGTAVSYMLMGLKSNWTQYDDFVIFFEDLNTLLQRIAILASRLPEDQTYEDSLMDVFGIIVILCGYAQKHLELGNFSEFESFDGEAISNVADRATGEWARTSLSQDGDSSVSANLRQRLEQKLEDLEILAKSKKSNDPEAFQQLQQELRENQKRHTDLLKRLETIPSSENVVSDADIQGQMEQLIEACDEQRRERGLGAARLVADSGERSPSANRIREKLPQVESETNEYLVLKETRVPGTCAWIFSEPQWKDWVEQVNKGERYPTLAVTGAPGVGKSHLAAAIFDELWAKASENPSEYACAQFYFREHHRNLSTFFQGLTSMINQIAEQDETLSKAIEGKLSETNRPLEVQDWEQLGRDLLAPCFPKDGKHCLYVVFDGVDEMDDSATLAKFIHTIQAAQLRIAVVLTCPPQLLSELIKDDFSVRLEVNNGKQLQDMRAIIWNRLGSFTSTRSYSRYAKQRIAETVERVSPSKLLPSWPALCFMNVTDLWQQICFMLSTFWSGSARFGAKLPCFAVSTSPCPKIYLSSLRCFWNIVFAPCHRNVERSLRCSFIL